MANLRRSSIFMSANAALRLAVGLVTAPLLVRLLGVREYGLWAVLGAVVATVSLLDLEITSAVKYYLAADHARKDWKGVNAWATTSFWIVTALAAIGTAAMLLGAAYLSRMLFRDAGDRSEATRVLLVLAVGLPLRFWHKWLTAVEAALLRFDVQVMVEIPSGFAVQLGSVAVALIWKSAYAVAILQTGIIAATCAAHYGVLRSVWPCGRERGAPLFCTASARRLVRYGASDWITAVGSTIFTNADRLIVNSVLGTTAAGLYSAATAVVNKIVELPVSFTRLLPPAVSAANANGDRDRLIHLFRQAIRASGTITFLAASGVIFLARPIAVVMVGAGYAPDLVPVLRVMAAVYGVQSLCVTSFWFASGLGRPLINSKWSIAGSAAMCVLIRVLGAQYGLLGAAWGNAGYLLIAFVTLAVVRLMDVDLGMIAADYGRPLLGMLACGLIAATGWYGAMGFRAQLAIAGACQLPLLLWIMSWSWIKDLSSSILPRVMLPSSWGMAPGTGVKGS
jgi:O-antigen/teichoic acid export membrane protein